MRIASGRLPKVSYLLSVLSLLVFVAPGCRMWGRAEGPAGEPEAVPHVMTSDIQAGIENHVEERTREGDGYFHLSHESKELKLKLVRVHTEYLANLGPRRHFACVDLVDTDGDVYDVDFFLEGDPGSMQVTQTTVHKLNGKPFYTWKQKRDGTWHRVEVDEVTPRLLGVVRGEDEFEFLYRAHIPKITGTARMWLPLASSDDYQTVQVKSMRTPGEHRVTKEPEHGNRVLFLELGPEHSGKHVEIRYHVKRKEKAAYPADDADLDKYLGPELMVPQDQRFWEIATDVTEGKETDLRRARALYDHVLDRMRYAKYGTGWGEGNATFACDAGRGNCTDFHSYFIALARAIDIPARFAIGAGIPSDRNEGAVNGYHCWVEFYADGKWWPVDISEADKYSILSTYYFGHHPANRIELSRGRDLELDPGPQSGPINFLAYPVLEVERERVNCQVRFAFTRKDQRYAARQ